MFTRVFCFVGSNAVLLDPIFWVVVSSCHFFINSFSTDMARQIIFLVPKQIDKAEPKESAYILLMAAGCILKLQLPVQSCRR